MEQSNLIAGLVLGSNSFHLVTARLDGGTLKGEDHLQEAVQLAADLNDEGRLETACLDRARACLDRFAARLNELEPGRVAAVATGVLRQAGNADEVVSTAAAMLGVPVQVLSGEDEAFLTYVGVTLSSGPIDDNRLVVDIGGASTEFVVGRGGTVMERKSADIGCIAVTKQFFAEGISREAFVAAEDEVGAALQPVAVALSACAWGSVVGTGGTIMGAGRIMQLRRLCGSAVTRKGLDRMKSAMIDQRLTALGEGIVTADRMAILPGGVALLSAMFDILEIERMALSPGALREGLLVMMARGALPGARVVQPGS